MKELKIKGNLRSDKPLKKSYSRPELVQRSVLSDTQSGVTAGRDSNPGGANGQLLGDS